MEVNDRIEQWEKMTREAPDDMAWFSLGNAYRDAGRHADAEKAFASAIELNPQMSRAYQLRGQCLMHLLRNEMAGDVLEEGYKVSAARGDVMPQRAMGSLLEKLGRTVPKVAAAPSQTAPAEDLGPDALTDRKSGLPGKRLPDAPMRGPLGQFILAHYTQTTWNEWIRQGTKVINELRLDFSNVNHQKMYDEQMMEWLGVTKEDVEGYTNEKK